MKTAKILSKKYIKNVFKADGIQLSKDSITLIEKELKLQVHFMARRCRDSNVKKLTPDLLWVVKKKLNWER